jgi:hypothetical protein
MTVPTVYFRLPSDAFQRHDNYILLRNSFAFILCLQTHKLPSACLNHRDNCEYQTLPVQAGMSRFIQSLWAKKPTRILFKWEKILS